MPHFDQSIKFTLAFVVWASLSTQSARGQCVGPVGQNPAEWEIAFVEEFEGSSLNMSVWNDHIWYENSDPVINYAVSNGTLKIWPAQGFVNRTIDTDGKYEQTYGYYEARMKLNIGLGVWPAFWLYAHPPNDRPEIDIMEAYPGGGSASGWGDDDLHPVNYGMTLHKANEDYSWHEIPYAIKYTDFYSPLDLSADFHVYGVNWQPQSVEFFFDGAQVGPTFNYYDDYWNKPMYILLDLWFGSASGTPNSTDTPMGPANSFEIDYVRTWQSGVCVVMPVEWSKALTARCQAKSIMLEWQTENQINHEKFVVEHASDAFKFEPVGEIYAEDHLHRQTYQFVHHPVTEGKHYYRVRQIDRDGTTTLSNLASAQCQPESIRIAPNPARNTLHIHAQTDADMRIYHVSGQFIHTVSLKSGDNTIDATDWAAGMYFGQSAAGENIRFMLEKEE